MYVSARKSSNKILQFATKNITLFFSRNGSTVQTIFSSSIFRTNFTKNENEEDSNYLRTLKEFFRSTMRRVTLGNGSWGTRDARGAIAANRVKKRWFYVSRHFFQGGKSLETRMKQHVKATAMYHDPWNALYSRSQPPTKCSGTPNGDQ